jgi:PAS domain S-box-containing protein
LSDAVRPAEAVNVIFAVEGEEEREAFSAVMASECPGGALFFPSNIAEVEALYKDDRADAIVTDLRFHAGALADWLTFWPLPAVLLVDPEDELGRVDKTTRDEAALFVERSPGLGHIRLLPILIHKALNIRESAARQNAHLQMSEHQYLNLLQAIPDIVYTLDGNGRFIYLNDAVRDIGYEPGGLIGKHFSEIVHPEDVPRVSRIEALLPLRGLRTGDAAAPKLFDERRSGNRMTRNLELRLRLGSLSGDYLVGSVTSYGEVSCSGYALPEFEGKELGTVGIIRDVSLRKGHEQALEAALASKEVLLKEIHHRVKNNLQIVSSLLNIQETTIVDAAARKVFLECQTQIQTMSMVHEVLYRSSSFEGVEMQSYFERLIDYLSSVYEGGYRGISCGVASEGVALNLDEAIPVALIVNELVSNCMKHAFPNGRVGRVDLSLREVEGAWLLEVEDDGVGFRPEGTSGGAPEQGIGTELVYALASQLHGVAARSAGRAGSGARVSISFPKSVSA